MRMLQYQVGNIKGVFMNPKILVDNKTKRIISFGFCEFTPEKGQTVYDSPVLQLPDKLEICKYDATKKSVFVDSSLKNAVKWKSVRVERDLRLSATDWTQLSDSPLSSEKKTAWKKYRQALRDVTETQSDPEKIIWPREPE